GRDEHLQLRPLELKQALQVLHYVDRVDRGRGHEVVRGGQARCGAVVEYDAVVAQHHAVAAAPWRKRVPAVDVDAVEELRNISALQFDLAERRDVDYAHARADIERLAAGGIVGRFAGSRIRMRPQPQPGG